MLHMKSMVFLLISIGVYDLIRDLWNLVPPMVTLPDEDYLVGL